MVAENGEYSNVNYDHCVLGLRASRRLLPYLPSGHRQLAMAQAVWYMPQGLDVWDQLLCEFPGHYARDDKKNVACALAAPMRTVLTDLTVPRGTHPRRGSTPIMNLIAREHRLTGCVDCRSASSRGTVMVRIAFR
jgi:hypothetical protein